MMRVFWQEVRKILRPLPVFFLTTAALIYGFVVLRYPYRCLTEFQQSTSYIQVAADFVELCGNTLEEGEFESAAELLLIRYKAQLEAAVRGEPRFAEIGVTDYEGYVALQRKILFSRIDAADGAYWDQDTTDATFGYFGVPLAPYDPQENYTLSLEEQAIEQDDFAGEMIGYAELRLQCLKSVGGYPYSMEQSRDPQYQAAILSDSSFPGSARRQLASIFKSWEESPSVMPGYWFTGYTGEAMSQLAILLVCSVCILLAPILTRDGMTRVRHLQYASKKGRKTPRTQFWAMIFSAGLVSLLEIAITFAAFLKPWRPFLPSSLNSPMDHSSFFWYTGTFGGWLLCTAALLFLFALAVACLIFVISKLSKQYISLLLCVTPVAAILCFLGRIVFILPLAMGGFNNCLYNYLRLPYVDALVCGVLLVAGLALVGMMVKKQRRMELM